MLNYALSRLYGEGAASQLYRAYRRLGPEDELREVMGGSGLTDVQSAESSLARQAANAIVAGDARKAAEKKNQLIRLIRQKDGSSANAESKAQTRIVSQLPARRAFSATPDRRLISVISKRMTPEERRLMGRESRLITVR